MLNFISVIFAFGLMIMLHELGHLLVALAFGVKIEKFSIGFGSPLVNFKRWGIDFRIAWIPLGGYVKMHGEDPEDKDSDPSQSFQNKAWWKKSLIALAGPAANLLLGIVLFMLAFSLPQNMEDHYPVIGKVEGSQVGIFAPGDSIVSINNHPVQGFYQGLLQLSDKKENSISLIREGEELAISVQPAGLDTLLQSISPRVEPVVGEVQTGMPAYRAGLEMGDRIVAVDSVQVIDWYHMRELIVGNNSGRVSLDIERNGKKFRRQMPLEPDGTGGNQKIIGIMQSMPVRIKEQIPVQQAITTGFTGSFRFIGTYYKALYTLFRQPAQLKSSIRGPVSIVSMSQQVSRKGISTFILFFGSISLILMMMNLLPIPVLDGGHILFCLIEGITGRPIPTRIQAIIQRIFFALLITLMAYVFYKDLMALLLRFIYRF